MKDGIFVITLDKQAFANYLYNARVDADVSSIDMAKHLECHQPQIANIEGGHHQPRLETLLKYLDRIGKRLVIVPK